MRFLRLFPLLILLCLLPGCSLLENAAVAPPPEDYVAEEDGFRYTKSCLTPQEQYVCDQLLAGLRDQVPRIEGLYPDNAMIERAIRAIDRDYPEIFWFSGTGQIETTYLADTPMEAAYIPSYTMDEGLRAEVQARVDDWTPLTTTRPSTCMNILLTTPTTRRWTRTPSRTLWSTARACAAATPRPPSMC